MASGEWQHRVIRWKPDSVHDDGAVGDKGLEALLDDFGLQGWQLVSVVHEDHDFVLFFRKPGAPERHSRVW